jgi:hypothetical protein
MRSPVDVVMGRVGGFAIREIARRTVPCYKHVIEGDDGREQLAVCLVIDSRYLYRFPYENLHGLPSLTAKASYLRGEMEHLRLREFQPGVCRYANRKESATA